MCFVVTCWERADLLALVCAVFCEFVTFPLVSWVRCGTWLYRFLICATLLTLISVWKKVHVMKWYLIISKDSFVWNVYFLHFFISFKYDFHVNAERIPRYVKKYLRRFFFKTYLMARKIFRRDIYRYSIAQYFYFFYVGNAWRSLNMWHLGRREMIFLRSDLNFRRVPAVPLLASLPIKDYLPCH